MNRTTKSTGIATRKSTGKSTGKSTAIVLPDWVAVAVVDPGGVTGCARGLFPVGSVDSIRGAISAAQQLESWEESGTISDQVNSVVDIMSDWFCDLNLSGMQLNHMCFVIEDFKLRQRHADLRPVQFIERLDTLWEFGGISVERQTPSDAMTYVTNQRLRAWGAWVVGSEHRRDAMRHLLLKVSRVLDKGLPEA